MNGFVSLATSITVSLVVSTAVLLMLIHPLKRVLALLCKNGESTPFWVSFTIVMLFAVPLFFTMVWAPQFAESFRTVRVALVTSLFGLIGGLVVIGYKIANARQT